MTTMFGFADFAAVASWHELQTASANAQKVKKEAFKGRAFLTSRVGNRADDHSDHSIACRVRPICPAVSGVCLVSAGKRTENWL